MNKDIFETTVLKLNAKLKGGEKESDEALFIFEKDSNGEKEELERITVPVKKDEWGGSAEVKDYKVPVTADDEPCYGLTYRVESGGETYPGKQVYTVWPLSVTISAKKEGGSEAFPDAEFKITQGEKSEIVMVDSQTGRYEYPLTQKERFVIDVDFPYELIKWTQGKEKGRVLEAEVRRKPYRAAIYAPVPPNEGEPIKQYVNLAGDPRENQGHSLLVTIGPEEVMRPYGLKGEIFHVQVVFDEGNSARNAPRPCLKINGEEISPDDTRTCQGQVSLSADGALETFEVELGCAGGDACEVTVGVTEKCEDAAFKVVNWRKLYYRMARPQTMPPPDLTALIEALKEVFIEFESREEEEISVGTGPEGSWINGNELGLGDSELLVVGTHNSSYFLESLPFVTSPHAVIFLFCHLQLDTAFDTIDLTCSPSDRIAWQEQSDVPGVAYDVNAVHGNEYLALPAALQTGENAVHGARWESLASNGDHHGKTGRIPDDHIRIALAGHRETGGRVFVKFPDPAAAVLHDGEQIQVFLDLHLAKGPYPAESDRRQGNGLLIAAHTLDGEKDTKSICSTLAHELGHAMQMVCTDSLDVAGIEDCKAEHSRWYDTRRGHQGDHCAAGIPGAVYGDETRELTGFGDRATCPMYGAPTHRHATAYCDNCKKLIKAARLDDLT